ncbi:MAG: hypothetical protein PHH13_02535 [Candidatus Peribacteraceae bacterium]|nr:hypothetical protein [Candidatus Peribacteraceae bacterium]
MPSFYHLIVYVPIAHADVIRTTLAESGAGNIGNYDGCSFSVRGTGRFRPLKGAHPAIGSIGKIEEVEEERIEALVTEDKLKETLRGTGHSHPPDGQ